MRLQMAAGSQAISTTRRTTSSRRSTETMLSLIYKTCIETEHLFEDVKLGDVKAAYERVVRVHNRQTTAGFIDAQVKFTSSGMHADHADLGQFISLVASRAKRVTSLGGTISEAEKITVLLTGLLPEFKSEKTKITAEPLSSLTFAKVSTDLTDFAITEEILSLKTGGSKGTSKLYAANVGASNAHLCRNWTREGKCSYGDDCKFSHDVHNADTMASIRQQRNGKGDARGRGKGKGKGGRGGKGPCGFCNKPNHSESECFAKQNQNMSPSTRSYINNCLEERKIAKRGRSPTRSQSPSRRHHRTRSNTRGLSPDSNAQTQGYHVFMIHSQENPHFNGCYFNGDGVDAHLWIGDSGANNHSANDKSYFIIGSVKYHNLTVGVGSGTIVCHMTGNVLLLDSTTGQTMLLIDVLYLPQCGKNIISESKLDAAGYRQVKPANGTCIVSSTADDMVLMTATMDDERMYVYNNVAVISNSSDAIWMNSQLYFNNEQGTGTLASSTMQDGGWVLRRRSGRVHVAEMNKRLKTAEAEQALGQAPTEQTSGQVLSCSSSSSNSKFAKLKSSQSAKSSITKPQSDSNEDLPQLIESSCSSLSDTEELDEQPERADELVRRSYRLYHQRQRTPSMLPKDGPSYARRASRSSNSSSSIRGSHADEGAYDYHETEVVEDKSHNFIMGRHTSRVTGKEVREVPPIHSNRSDLQGFHAAREGISSNSKFGDLQIGTASTLLVQEDNGNTEHDRVLEAHMQCGHLGFAEVRKLLGLKASKDYPVCHSCELTRATLSNFTNSQRPRADAVLKRLWMDIGFGRMSKLVFHVVLDDYSKMLWVDELPDKTKTLNSFITLQLKLENDKQPRKVAAIARDNDAYYRSNAWKDYANEHGIQL